MGAEHDPNAPWNEPVIEPVEKEVEYSCVMRREGNVSTINYSPGGVFPEWDGIGYVTIHEDDDFSGTDWVEEWKECYPTPSKLIGILGEIAKDFTEGKIPERSNGFWKSVVEECEGWKQEDEEVDLV